MITGASNPPCAPPKLIADAMLGALVRWLQALDLDVAYDPELDDPEIVELTLAEDRTILTRDLRLTERRAARNHLLIRSAAELFGYEKGAFTDHRLHVSRF